MVERWWDKMLMQDAHAKDERSFGLCDDVSVVNSLSLQILV